MIELIMTWNGGDIIAQTRVDKGWLDWDNMPHSGKSYDIRDVEGFGGRTVRFITSTVNVVDSHGSNVEQGNTNAPARCIVSLVPWRYVDDEGELGGYVRAT